MDLPINRSTTLAWLALLASPLLSLMVSATVSIEIQFHWASLLSTMTIPSVILVTETGFLRDNLEKVIRLTDILHFTQPELHFIDAFNNGNYYPELLFEDKDIITRIQNHPMAIWKTR